MFNQNKKFRFENYWLREAHIGKVVNDSWVGTVGGSLQVGLENVLLLRINGVSRCIRIFVR